MGEPMVVSASPVVAASPVLAGHATNVVQGVAVGGGAAPGSVGAGVDAVAASLRELDALHASGLLSQAEYEAKRAEILARI